MVGEVKQGEIWVSDQRPGSPALAGKIRPVLIVQDDHLSGRGLTTVLIAPMTTKINRGWPDLRPVISAGEMLKMDSQVMVDQVTTVEREKLLRGPLKKITAEEWMRVRLALAAVFGLV